MSRPCVPARSSRSTRLNSSRATPPSGSKSPARSSRRSAIRTGRGRCSCCTTSPSRRCSKASARISSPMSPTNCARRSASSRATSKRSSTATGTCRLEDRDRFLHTIQRHTERLNSLLEDLLTLSRLESINPGLRRESTSLADLLDQPDRRHPRTLRGERA